MTRGKGPWRLASCGHHLNKAMRVVKELDRVEKRKRIRRGYLAQVSMRFCISARPYAVLTLSHCLDRAKE